jgi:hypothetical protein
MSVARSQALIHAPPPEIWELVGNPRRHPEWWPRVIEVRGETFEEGNQYVQVTRDPMRNVKTVMALDKVEDLRAINLHCTMTGTYAHWLLTEAQGDTFVEVEFGMEPIRFVDKILDATIAKPYFERWISQSLQGLEQAAAGRSAGEGRATAERRG